MSEVEAWRHLAQQIELDKWQRQGLCAEIEGLFNITSELQYGDILDVLGSRYISATALYGIDVNTQSEMEDRMEYIAEDRPNPTSYFFKRGKPEPRIIFCLLMAELAAEYPYVPDMKNAFNGEDED